MDTVSGVIAVAQATVQLGQTIQTLVGFWKAVRDAPEDVKMIFEEISMLSTLIEQTREKEPHEESNPIIDTASSRCNDLLSKLKSKLPASTSDFNIPSFRVRTWKRLKHALKKNEIKELMGTIERIKTTLMFSQIHNIGRTQRLLELYISRQQIPSLSVTKNAYYSQCRQSPVVGVDFRLAASCQNTSVILPAEPTGTEMLRNDFQKESPRDLIGPVCSSPDTHSRSKTYSNLSSWGISVRTPLYSISYRKRAREVTSITSSGTKTSIVEYLSCIIYPSRMLTLFGLSCGLWMEGSTSTSWRWSLTPFNVIPENSPIFEFCRRGHISGIETLLQSGYASVRDMDPAGQTPLDVAAQSCQVQTAKFLLQEGADPRQGFCIPRAGWPDPPDPKEVVENKLSIVALFQRHSPEIFDEYTIYQLLIRYLVFYRPQKLILMKQTARRDAFFKAVVQLSQELPPSADCIRADLVYEMIRHWHCQAPLRWMLRSIKGASASESSLLLTALKRKLPYRDQESTRIIMQKTKDLHRKFVFLGPHVSYATATSLAMRQPSMFFPFRDNLLALGYSVDAFVEKELGIEDSPLASEGWDRGTLTALFNSNTFPNTHNGVLVNGFFRCHRCGSTEYSSPTFELPWRRHLRNFRNQKSHDSCCGEHPSPKLSWLPQELADANLMEPNEFNIEDPGLLALGNTYSPKATPDKTPGRLDASGVLQPWPYKWVCASRCFDDISVSGAYENDSMDEPDLPPLTGMPPGDRSSSIPPVSPGNKNTLSDIEEVNGGDMDMDCPTRGMPGAFIE